MYPFTIFVEGKADEKFLADYANRHFGVTRGDLKVYILGSVDGYTISGGEVRGAISENHELGHKTILILDADDNFEERRSRVLGDFGKFGIPVELFLFPDNISNGRLETLLSAIAADPKPIECFLDFEQCVKEYGHPLEKARIFAYLDAVLPAAEKEKKPDPRKEEHRDYCNTHWNLHHQTLNPLHQFLSPFFTNTNQQS